MIVRAVLIALWVCGGATGVLAQDLERVFSTPPSSQPAESPAGAQPGEALRPGVGRFPFIEVDVPHRQVRVQCQALAVDAPLEFFCVRNGTNEHESVLRSPARASHIHMALLMLGLQPGQPVHFDEAQKAWVPPTGAPLKISVEYQKDGRTIRAPASDWMRDLNTKKPMPDSTWVFAGSRITEDGVYAADLTGYVVSIVNFDLCCIDVPQLRSNANETLEWERNPDKVPPKGTRVTMIIEPAPPGAIAPATRAATGPTTAGEPIDVLLIQVDRQGKLEMDHHPITIDELRKRLGELKDRRPVHPRLAVQGGAPGDVVRQVIAAGDQAGVKVEMVAWPEGAR